MTDKRRIIRPWMTITLLIVLLITSNLYWMYQVLDREVTLGYKRNVIYTCEQGRKDLFNIFEVALHQDIKSMSPETLLSTFPGSFEKKSDGIVVVGQIVFEIQDGAIVGIKDEGIYKSIELR